MGEAKIKSEERDFNFENVELEAALGQQSGDSKYAIGNAALERRGEVWIGDR